MMNKLYTLFILIGLTLSLSVNAEDKVYPTLTTAGGTYDLVTSVEQIEDGGVYLFADKITGKLNLLSSYTSEKFSTVSIENDGDIPPTLYFEYVNSPEKPYESILVKDQEDGSFRIVAYDGGYVSNTTKSGTPNAMNLVDGDVTDKSIQFTVSIFAGQENAWKFYNKNKGNSEAYFRCSKVNSTYYYRCSTTVGSTLIYKKRNTPSSSTAPFTMSTARYATLYYSDKDIVLPVGLTAYTYRVSSSSNAVYLTPSHTYVAGDKIPADVAVVVKGEPGTYQLTLETPDEGLSKPENILLGCDDDTELSNDDSKYFFKLSLNDNKELGSVGFYWANEAGSAFTTQAHKAYLVLDKLLFASGEQPQAKKIIMIETPAATGVTSANISGARREKIKSSDALGRNISGNAKGLVIRNGKKYIQK